MSSCPGAKAAARIPTTTALNGNEKSWLLRKESIASTTKKGNQSEFHSLHGRGNHSAGEGTDDAAAYPQDLTKDLDGEYSVPTRALIGGEGGDDGIGFVGKRICGISPAHP